jgi:hypothetical protein
VIATTKIDTADKAFIRNKNFKAIPVVEQEDDGTYGVPLLTKEEYEARIEEGLRDYEAYKAGDMSKGTKRTREQLRAFLGYE